MLFLPLYLFSQSADSIITKINIASNDNSAKYYALIDSGTFYFDKDVTVTIKLCEEALKYSGYIKDPVNRIKVYDLLGREYKKSGVYEKAIDSYYRMIFILNSAEGKYPSQLANAYLNLGETYRASQDYPTALSFISKSYNLYNELSDERGMSHALDREAAVNFEIAVNFLDTTKMLGVIETANKSLAISEKYGDFYFQMSTINILAACYSFLNQTEKALSMYSKALVLSDERTDNIDRPNILNNLASLYLKSLKNYDKCIEYALRSYNESTRSDIPVYKREASLLLYNAYKKKGDIVNALYYLEQYDNINIFLYNSDKNNRIKETERKIAEINSNLESEKRTRRMIILIGFFLITVAALLVFIVKQKALKNLNADLNEKNKIISEQNSKLETLIKNQNIFFSILAHDMRSPFQSILGFLNLLRSDFDKLNDEEKKEYIGYVSISSEKIYRFIERLLEWSRLQGGHITYNPENINLKHIVDELTEMHYSSLLNKNLKLENRIPEDLYVFADADFVSAILRNLVDNAIKYSFENSEIKIYSYVKNGIAEITVADEGVGIPAGIIPNLFSIDKKVNTKGTNMEEGVGLGLKIVKKMIEDMNGTLNIESEAGKGTKFIFTLPAEK